MKYDFSKTYDMQKANEYMNKLMDSKSKIELKKIHPKRSVSQNSYLHVLFSLWGNEFGYLMDETKQVVKKELGYTYIKTDTFRSPPWDIECYEKTSKMDSKELTIFIDKFRDWSAQTCELYLPSSAEYIEEQIMFDNQIEKGI